MTNKDMLILMMDDTDKLIDVLIESPCEHCGFYHIDEGCDIDDEYLDKDLVEACSAGIKKWLDMVYEKDD